MNETEEKKKIWVFFDYSGTLIDTAKALSNTYTEIFGTEFTEKKVKSLYKDFSKYNKIRIMLKYKLNPLKWLFGGKRKFDALRKKEFQINAQVFPGIPEVLKKIKKIADIKLGIVTHDTELEDQTYKQNIFQHFGIPDLFDAIITDYENKETRFNEYIEKSNIKNAIVVGDNQYDINLGKQNNFITIGVTWGFSTREEFNANFISDNPNELLQKIISIIQKMKHQQLHGDPN